MLNHAPRWEGFSPGLARGGQGQVIELPRTRPAQRRCARLPSRRQVPNSRGRGCKTLLGNRIQRCTKDDRNPGFVSSLYCECSRLNEAALESRFPRASRPGSRCGRAGRRLSLRSGPASQLRQASEPPGSPPTSEGSSEATAGKAPGVQAAEAQPPAPGRKTAPPRAASSTRQD